MPTKSAAQERLMQGAAHNPSFAKKVGVPTSVAKEYIKSSKSDASEADLNMWLLDLYARQTGYGAMKGDDDKTEFPALLKLPEEKKLAYDAEEKKQAIAEMKDKLKEIFESLTGMKQGPKPDDDLEVRNGEYNDAVLSMPGDPLSEVGGEVEHVIETPVDKDAGPLGRAAGILFLTDDNKTLLIRRGDGGDFPYTWCVPGGHQNDEETLEECARRECEEETGIKYEGELTVLHDSGQFCTYIARHAEIAPVALNYESTGYDWCPITEVSEPLHPGLRNAIRAAMANTEYDVAELIKDGVLPSPQMYANLMLLAIRITGTGLAYRSSIGEHVWRDPSLYLNQDFLNRCNGLIVILDHPDGAILNGEEFNKRAIGSIILPYILNDEVWGIAKIYDEDAIKEICSTEVSTSPSVVFDQTADNTVLTTESGEPLLIEGKPFLLDHIAIVTEAKGSKGVWDKGGDPTGVLLNNETLKESK